jgi:hypothetical protein
MKQITPEEAKNYLPKNEDLMGLESEFYTRTPDPLDPEWELVTYYTSRKLDIYKNREGDGDSWVYILSNPSMPGLLKIGSTTKAPDKRAKQVSRGTGVPLEFELEYMFKCFNSAGLEYEIHKELKSQRVNKQKEFFKMDLESAKKTIEEIGRKYV